MEKPICPECGGENLRFGCDEYSNYTECIDCKKIVEESAVENIPKAAYGPGSYQWDADR